MEWKVVSDRRLKKAIDLAIPEGLHKRVFEPRKKYAREMPIKLWRHAAVVAMRLNGASNQRVADYIGYNNHSSVIHAMKNYRNCLDGYGDERLLDRVNLIRWYIDSRTIDDKALEAQFDNILVYYHEDYIEREEETNTLGGWKFDIVQVRAIIESDLLVGGVMEVEIEGYNENLIVERLNELK